ncbi:putative peptide transporter ptr2 [Chaetomidium leptoderma]|uniref:Peptide transporter ptr2 n=1 Tax=Chaetomidium leptoderma TaxID=669021 RepID=A0AAN6VQ71_9PEZI|nr:putative peptide transporter ptr2 [Chaetomidium leptoderma]
MTQPEIKSEKGPIESTEPLSDVESSLPRDATDEEARTLPRVVDRIPAAAWAAALVGSAERFSYYAIVSIWQNYMQNERASRAVPGALGLGQSVATSISNGFFVFSFLTPMLFAVVSDVWLGRYNTLIVAFCLLICGSSIMFATSLPAALDNGAGVPGLAVSMVFIGLGIGGVKSTITPFIGDQYTQRKPQLIRQKNGELAVVDGSRTIQFLYNAFYWLTNIASLSSIPATFLEREFGFWTAYLMAAISLVVSLGVLLSLKSKLIKVTPHENVLPKAIKVLSMAARNGFRLDHAKGSYQTQRHGHGVPWDDSFVDELKTGLIACRVIFSFAFFYLSITQMYNNFISQAGQMNLHGVPNDMIQAMAGVACVLFGPVIQALYNALAQRRLPFGPIARISTAFLICGAGMAYASGLQQLIYHTGPCYDAPLACGAAASDGGPGRLLLLPNDVNVWLQLPVYVALAIAEIFGLVTASEYSYEKAPRGMRSVVQALVQLSACLGALMGMAISPASRDPYLVVVYAVLAGVMGLCSLVFWWVFRKYDRIDRQLNRLIEDTTREGSE